MASEAKIQFEIDTALREQGYRLAVLDFQEMLLESKKRDWYNPQELYNHLADRISEATGARELNNFTPEKEYRDGN
jgi:hypothetical protein